MSVKRPTFTGFYGYWRFAVISVIALALLTIFYITGAYMEVHES